MLYSGRMNDLGHALIEIWRFSVVVASAMLLSALLRVYLERIGKRKPKLDTARASPTLALVNIAGVSYITLDVARNFGNPSLNWYETPLASAVLIAGAFLFWKAGRAS